MKKKKNKVAVLGNALTGKAIALETREGSVKNIATVYKEVEEQFGQEYNHEIKQPEFKTKKELDEFLKQTKHIPIKNVPKMPFTLLKDYVKEYMLIYDKKSNLTRIQRIHVKNVVHYNVRKGTIILK